MVGVVFLLVLFSVSLGKEITRRVEVNQEIGSLEDEIQQLESRNAELNDLLAYLNTSALVEKEARLKLGLQKDGEKVLVIPGVGGDAAHLSEVQHQEIQEAIPNPQKWWRYFFN